MLKTVAPKLRKSAPSLVFTLLFLAAVPSTLHSQDFQVNIDKGASSIRLAAAGFKSVTPDASTFKQTFDTTLFADLSTAGIFDMVSKSLAPQTTPGSQSEINLGQWSAAPASAAMVAFGSVGVQGGRLVVSGFLDDAKNTQFPQVFAKQYNEEPSIDSARQISLLPPPYLT
jgi:TolB protein